MRILIYNWKDSAHPLAGGAEVYTERVAADLVRRRHDVTLFVAAVEARPEREIVDGYQVIRRGGRFGVYREARKFWRHAGEGRFDVVLDVCNTRPFLSPRYVRSVPVVALIFQVAREVWKYEMPYPVALAGRHIFEPWWLRTYRDVPVLTISASSASSLAEYGIGNATVLSIGADPSERPLIEKAITPTVVFLGRLSSNKRPHEAIEAFGLVRAEYPEARLWVMGDGPMRAGLEADAPPGVEILGHVPWAERQERLATGNVLVATSVREGWGLNVSEAAAVGTPSIGYDVDGLRDSITLSGGHLVEPTPANLGAALLDYFAGRVTLTPRISTVGWSVVGGEVARALNDAVIGCGDRVRA